MPDTPPQDSREAPTLVTPTLRDPALAGGAPVEQHLFTERYIERSVIGEGGMGEVRLCHDLRIGRDVALKIRKPGAGTRAPPPPGPRRGALHDLIPGNLPARR